MGFFDQIYISAPVLGAITALIAVSTWVIGAAKSRSEQAAADAAGWGFSTFFGVVFGTSGAVTPFAFALSPIYGLLHYAFVLLSAFIFGIIGIRSFKDGTISLQGLFPVSSFLSSLAFPPILLLVAIPSAVLPYIRAETPTPPASQEIGTIAIKETFSRIKDGLSEIERNIALESQNIDQSIENLTQDIESRNQELTALVDEQARMAEEIKKSRELAGLTEDQAKAVFAEFNRNKVRDQFLDYGVGFVLGLLSSGFYFVMQRFTSRRPQLPTQEPST